MPTHPQDPVASTSHQTRRPSRPKQAKDGDSPAHCRGFSISCDIDAVEAGYLDEDAILNSTKCAWSAMASADSKERQVEGVGKFHLCIPRDNNDEDIALGSFAPSFVILAKLRTTREMDFSAPA
ncbi:MAG: hypothetical protein Q9197_004125 [Variospora fuerteventurae]